MFIYSPSQLFLILDEWKMSAILRNFFFRKSALNSNSRHVSSFKGNFGGQRNSVTKWYWLLAGSAASISYFALKSFKNSNQIQALQIRKVMNIQLFCNNHSWFIFIVVFRMSWLKRQSNWQQEKKDSLNSRQSSSMGRFTVSLIRFAIRSFHLNNGLKQ